jgi:hypothetical protein
MRDLKADLELCNKATPGPWEVFPPLCGPEGQTVYQVDSGGPICDVSDPYPRGDNKPQENMMFIAQAREGWPHAIERAIKAEAEVEQLKGEIEQLLEIAFAHIPDVMRRYGYYIDANPEEDSEE